MASGSGGCLLATGVRPYDSATKYLDDREVPAPMPSSPRARGGARRSTAPAPLTAPPASTVVTVATAPSDATRAGRAPGGAPPGTLPAVLAASRAVYAAIDLVDTTIADRLGVHRSDLRCLNLLEHGAQTPSAIGTALGLTSGAVTALVDRLERAGFARRTRATADRRSVQVEIPPESYARVGHLYGTIAGAISAAFADLGADEIAATTRGLARFADGCRAGVARIAADAPP